MSESTEGKPFYFDDCIVGEGHEAASYEVSAEEIMEFAGKWDPQPWHIDEALAKQSFFGGLTCCSAHIFSIFCITSQRWKSGVVQQAIAGLGFDDFRIHRPIYAGDTVRAVSRIAAVKPSTSKPDRGVVTQSVVLINQNDEEVFSISALTMMAKDPARNPGI
ncbi:MAG: MaoC family dehydratase N-terminal domain-containing protein [Pseudomonadales bacterium]|nr:MaoC family dehydratase N-terminal domain-containing protein [Pseudomonadales bacterium]